MFKLGIIGSDNSHADQFAALANLEEGAGGMRVPGVRVTHLYGMDPARTKEVARNGNIPHIVSRPEEMIGEVDGVACVWRHGAKHLPDTLPLLEAGIPAFVDKPLACSVADARQLVKAAQRAGVGFASFTTLRYARSMVAFVETLPETAGELSAGMSSGPGHLDSEYGGVFFYGIHAVELMNATFGYGCESVRAAVHGGACQVACTFPGGALVTLNLLDTAQTVFHVAAFGTKGWAAHAVDTSTTYYDGMQVFVEALRSGVWPLTAEQLLEPVQILCAIELSMRENREVRLEEVG